MQGRQEPSKNTQTPTNKGKKLLKADAVGPSYGCMGKWINNENIYGTVPPMSTTT